MADDEAIQLALTSNQVIAREQVVEWIRGAEDIATLAGLYKLTDIAYDRVVPELGSAVTCGLIQRYLLECIRLDRAADDEIMTRFEAANTLVNWFYHLSEVAPDTLPILQETARQITDIYLGADDGLKNAIETGFLEHVLEVPALRHFFEHWAQDARLRDAWEHALEWGLAHPGFTRSLYAQYRDETS